MLPNLEKGNTRKGMGSEHIKSFIRVSCFVGFFCLFYTRIVRDYGLLDIKKQTGETQTYWHVGSVDPFFCYCSTG